MTFAFFGSYPFGSPVVTFDGLVLEEQPVVARLQRVVPPLRQGAGASR